MQEQLINDCKKQQHREMMYRAHTAIRYANLPVLIPESLDLNRSDRHICSFSKSLPHDNKGTTDKDQFEMMLKGIFEDPSYLSEITLGGKMKLVCPSCIHTYDILGAPKWSYKIDPHPAISSAEAAGEMIELQWMSILRDVPFGAYSTHPLVAQSIEDLNRLSDFRGPKRDGRVTVDTLFRGNSEGDLIGPFVSQFLYIPVKQGIGKISQLYGFDTPGSDFLLTRESVVRTLNGDVTPHSVSSVHRYMSTLRDGATYVHYDEPVQAFENAVRILLARKIPFNPGSPYITSNTLRNESPFVDYGIVDIFDLLHRVSHITFLACWFYKWTLLRLRPEEFGLILDRKETRDNETKDISIHPDWKRSSVRKYLFDNRGNVLLSTSYSEGSPAHPSYPSGHATISGAAATILKAFFNNDTMIDAVEPSLNGRFLRSLPYRLNVAHEIDKLASNIATFRNAAGIHYRSDMDRGIELGEQIALSFLKEEVKRYPGARYVIRKRNGEVVTIQ